MKKVVIVALGVSLAGLVAITVMYSSRSSVAAKGHSSGPAAAHDPVSERSAEVEVKRSASALEPQASSRPVQPSASNPELSARLRRAEELRRRIAEIRKNGTLPSGVPAQRPAGESSAAEQGKPTMPAAEGTGNQVGKPLGEYVDHLLKAQFNPVAGSCYEELLSRQPAAKGKLILNVTVAGDPRVGGVVDAVEVDPASTLDDSEFRLCMRESMFATVFDAPPGGEVTFTYPLDLSPE